MKKHFEYLQEEIKSRMSLFLDNRIDRNKIDLYNSIKPAIGELCFIRKNVEDIITGLNSIKQVCIDEINGICEKEWYNFEIEFGDFDPKNHNVYAKIKEFVDDGDLDILPALKQHIIGLPEFVVHQHDTLYHSYARDTLTYKRNDGTKKIISKDELVGYNKKMATEAKANILKNWSSTVAEIYQLANDKANLAKIIRIVE